MTLAWWDMWGCVMWSTWVNTGMVRCVRVWVYQDNRRERVMHWRNGACNLAYLLHSNTNQLTKLCHSALSGNNELCKVNVLSSTCAQWVVVRASSEREVLALTFSSFWSEDKTYHWWPNFITFFLCTGLSYRVSLFGKWVFHQPCSDKVVQGQYNILQPLWSILVHILSTLYGILVHILSTLYGILVHILSTLYSILVRIVITLVYLTLIRWRV